MSEAILTSLNARRLINAIRVGFSDSLQDTIQTAPFPEEAATFIETEEQFLAKYGTAPTSHYLDSLGDLQYAPQSTITYINEPTVRDESHYVKLTKDALRSKPKPSWYKPYAKPSAKMKAKVKRKAQRQARRRTRKCAR